MTVPALLGIAVIFLAIGTGIFLLGRWMAIRNARAREQDPGSATPEDSRDTL